MSSVISTLAEIYSQHIFVQFELSDWDADVDICLNRVDLNQLCMDSIQKWLNKHTELTIESAFPCRLNGSDNLKFIAKLVNGFVLQVGTTRIGFIPSETIDLEEFEIHQEWVDLPNWVADYYVPVQVDLEQQYLHLWGFISYADLTATATLDPIFRTYHINAAHAIANLDLLQANYELSALTSVPMAQAEIQPEIDRLSPTEAQSLIQQLHQRKSHLSPRLDLPFERWGAMLDDVSLLERYCHEDAETDLGMWWKSTKIIIWDGFELMGHFLNPPQAVPALGVDRVPSLHAIGGVDLGTEDEINTEITKLYQQQTDLPMPEGSIGIDALIPLLKSCQTPKIWWTAAEYLWTVQPEHPFLITRIRQLETQFAGQSIALMVSMILTPDDRTAVMVRLYRADYGTYLPLGLQLTIQDDLGKNLLADPHGNPYIVTAGAEYACIHLYFSINPGERFVACITLDDVKVLKPFKFDNYHHT